MNWHLNTFDVYHLKLVGNWWFSLLFILLSIHVTGHLVFVPSSFNSFLSHLRRGINNTSDLVTRWGIWLGYEKVRRREREMREKGKRGRKWWGWKLHSHAMSWFDTLHHHSINFLRFSLVFHSLVSFFHTSFCAWLMLDVCFIPCHFLHSLSFHSGKSRKKILKRVKRWKREENVDNNPCMIDKYFLFGWSEEEKLSRKGECCRDEKEAIWSFSFYPVRVTFERGWEQHAFFLPFSSV